MPRLSSSYVCQNCGFSTPKWAGQCPNCGQWNSFVETVVEKSGRSGGLGSSRSVRKVEPVKLSSVKKTEYGKRTSTKIGELDRVLGGGIVPGMVTLLAGEPGIGKSTLLLQISEKLTGEGSVVYVAGEESSVQIAGRASRMGISGEKIELVEQTDVDVVIETLSGMSQPALVIVDSIQTLTTADLSGGAGSVGQVRECSSRLISYAKRTNTPMFIVGHVTKEGTIAGPRVLEHMVDTVVWFEGDRREFLRIIRAIKNRFGPTDEVGIFSMGEKGLVEVDNPSNLFLGQAGRVSGSVVTVVMEGTRPMLVEIQALVVNTKLAIPRRSSTGVDPKRLELILAVLSRRAGIPLWDYDVFVNVAGGIRIDEPASDLAVALAIASAFYDKPLKPGHFAVGEVGLLGEIRDVINMDRRVKEAKRLGFEKQISSKENSTLPLTVKTHLGKS